MIKIQVIDRSLTLLKLNAFRIHENEFALTKKEKKENLEVIDKMIKTVKDKNIKDDELIRMINYYGYASSDMPKYKSLTIC